MSASVPFLDLHLHDDEAAVHEAIARVLARGWFVLGPEVDAFEQEFAAASRVPHAVAVGNGTDAIALALRAAGIEAGDEVIVPAMTAAYTALGVTMVGARPVFCDVDPVRCTMDAGAAAAAVTSRTAALVPVHLYGQAADVPALQAVAARHGLAVIEDCAQAHLATCAGVPVGTTSTAGTFSFYPTKNLGALGDGGAVVTRDAALARRVACLRNGGQLARYEHVEAGINSRLDDLQAAVLRTRLHLLPAWTERRRDLARRYRAALAGAPVACPGEVDAGHVYHLFAARSPARDRLRAHLAQQGIETLVHYPVPLNRQPAFVQQSGGAFPEAEALAREQVSLPLYPAMPASHIDAVVDAVHQFGPAAPLDEPRRAIR